MRERWLEIRNFPNYAISNFGRVKNIKFDRPVAVTFNAAGIPIVSLLGSGRRSTRSVKVLVAEAFLPKDNPRFNTPINLDCDPTNNRIDNLVWRPRWFAWKYHNQMRYIDSFMHTGKVRNIKTGIVYSSVTEACLVNGALFVDMINSIYQRNPVFPLYQYFEFV